MSRNLYSVRGKVHVEESKVIGIPEIELVSSESYFPPSEKGKFLNLSIANDAVVRQLFYRASKTKTDEFKRHMVCQLLTHYFPAVRLRKISEVRGYYDQLKEKCDIYKEFLLRNTPMSVNDDPFRIALAVARQYGNKETLPLKEVTDMVIENRKQFIKNINR